MVKKSFSEWLGIPSMRKKVTAAVGGDVGVGGGTGGGVGGETGIAAAAGGGGAGSAAIVLAIFQKVVDILKKLIKFAGLDKLFQFITSLKDLVLSPAFSIFSGILGGLGKILHAILTPLKPFFKLLELIGTFLSAVLSPLLPIIWDELIPAIEDMFSHLEEGEGIVMELAEELIPFLQELPTIIGQLVSVLISPEFLKRIIGLTVEFIRQLPAIIAAIPDFLALAVIIGEQIVPFLPDLIEIAKILGYIVAGIVILFKFIWGIFKAIGDFFGWLFGAMGGANFTIPTYLQSGGVVTSPTLAILGEKGTEYVFTEKQTAALAEMGVGQDRTLIYAIEDNNSLLRKILKSQLRMEEKWE